MDDQFKNIEEQLKNIDVKELISVVGPYLLNGLEALVVLFVGLFIIKFVNRLVAKVFARTSMDKALESFMSSLLSIGLKILLFVTFIGMLGVEMTSFIALLGGAGVAVGMALSGTLQNFAGGVMVLLFKPFKVGDFIEAQGYSGVVKSIQIFSTILTTADNKTVIIPNSPIATSSLINYSTQPTRRVDLTFGIGYGDDIDQAKAVLKEIVGAEERVLKTPETKIVVGALADSSVNFYVRPWVKSADYWDVYFALTEKVKKTFDEKGISIPFPQRDVHLHQVQE